MFVFLVLVFSGCFIFKKKTFLRQKNIFIEVPSDNVKSPVLDRFPIFQGSQNRPLERHFQAKGFQKSSTPYGHGCSGADLGVNWYRKRPKAIQELIFIDLR